MAGLNMTLKSVLREKIPENQLNKCLPADKPVVDNIICVLQDVIPFVNIPALTLEVHDSTYILKLPLTDHFRISFRDMRVIEAYSPARVANIVVACADGNAHLQVSIANENSIIPVTEFDVVRIGKRRLL